MHRLLPTDGAASAMRFGPPTLGLTDELRAALLDHAAHEHPRECCGIVFQPHGEAGLRYAPAANLSPDAGERFTLDPATWAACEDAGEIRAVVHSHPGASANPSHADGVGCERWGVPWLIVGWPSGCIVQLEPSGWRAPLVGREFVFGILDCFALGRDFMAREMGIEVPDFEREDRFWEATDDRPGQDLFATHLAEAGFVRLPDASDLRRGDVLLMRIRSRDIDNHLGLWLGEGRFLHAPYDQLSAVEMWGEAWQRRTHGVLRHRSLLP